MNLTRASKVGLAVAAVGVVTFLGTAVWLKSIRTTVLEIPASMHSETITKDFTVDYDAHYVMSVRFGNTVSPTVALCLLGANSPQLRPACSVTAPLLGFSWQFAHDGQVIASGTTSDLNLSRGSEGTSEVGPFGGLFAARKHNYIATIKFDQDGSSLKIPPPIIRVEMAGFNQMDFWMAGTALDLLGFALMAIGFGVAIVSLVKARRNRDRVDSFASSRSG